MSQTFRALMHKIETASFVVFETLNCINNELKEVNSLDEQKSKKKKSLTLPFRNSAKDTTSNLVIFKFLSVFVTLSTFFFSFCSTLDLIDLTLIVSTIIVKDCTLFSFVVFLVSYK